MPTYGQPANVPVCRCREEGLLPAMCPTGHLLECHFPLQCQYAGCSHLAEYDFPTEQVAELERRAEPYLRRLAADSCGVCRCVIETTMRLDQSMAPADTRKENTNGKHD